MQAIFCVCSNTLSLTLNHFFGNLEKKDRAKEVKKLSFKKVEKLCKSAPAINSGFLTISNLDFKRM